MSGNTFSGCFDFLSIHSSVYKHSVFDFLKKKNKAKYVKMASRGAGAVSKSAITTRSDTNH